jgi:hypothetical protein
VYPGVRTPIPGYSQVTPGYPNLRSVILDL